MPQLAHPRPPKGRGHLSSHTIDPRQKKKRNNTGSLRTPIQAAPGVYISNTVHMETVMNAIHLQQVNLLTASPPVFSLPPLHQGLLFIFHPRYAVLSTTEARKGVFVDGCIHVNSQPTAPKRQNGHKFRTPPDRAAVPVHYGRVKT